jgi:membrane associated rhomboid family serine protease
MSQPGWLGSLRVAALYMAGVILGCLGATCVEPTKYLLGASAGVYALILAHLGNLNSIIDVLWGQPIKFIQVVSTLEFHEY